MEVQTDSRNEEGAAEIPKSLDGFVAAQEEALRAFRKELPELWELLRAIDAIFRKSSDGLQHGFPGRVLPIPILWSEAWHAFLNAASLVARQQVSEPLVFCRRACEAALYAARIAAYPVDSDEFDWAADAWAKRADNSRPFDTLFRGKDNYEALGDLAMQVYKLRGEWSELGPHANIQTALLTTRLQEPNRCDPNPFALSEEQVQVAVLDVAQTFLIVVSLLLETLPKVGLPVPADAQSDVVNARDSIMSARGRVRGGPHNPR